MALTDQEIREVAAAFACRDNRALGTQAVRRAAEAIDGFLSTIQADLVAALPEPFRTASDATQKTELVSAVARKRVAKRSS
jgi:hypothetical protein